jgi:hypothetical protein
MKKYHRKTPEVETTSAFRKKNTGFAQTLRAENALEALSKSQPCTAHLALETSHTAIMGSVQSG